jgi:hypothetical protein
MKQGYVYMPYILHECDPIVIDSSFTPTKMIKSRYSVADLSSFNNFIINDFLLEERRIKLQRIMDRLKK